MTCVDRTFRITDARWAFDNKAWNPTEPEWLLALSCIPLEERKRIHKFVFKADAKASIAGWLMIRKFVHLATGQLYKDISVSRTENGRPYVRNSSFPLDFNVSHEGNFTVLAGETGDNVRVGVDIVELKKHTESGLSELFRLMNKSFTAEEWRSILASASAEKQAAMFYRHWCLKESYLKAVGVGICSDLQSISFKINTLSLSCGKSCCDTILYVNGVEKSHWKFHECLLDHQYCMTVALMRSTNAPVGSGAVPFTMLSFNHLIQEADHNLQPNVDQWKAFMNKKDK